MDTEPERGSAEQQLRELQQALPLLPAPTDLHDKIIRYCHDFHDCLQAVVTLEKRLRALRLSREPLPSRRQEAHYLELHADHLRLRFLYVRTQLRTLYTLPPILIAMHQMKESEWKSLIRAPHETIDGKTLLIKLNDIEQVAADQLSNIAGINSSLQELLRDYQCDEQDEKARFEQEICTGIKRIQEAIDELPEHIYKRMHQYPEATAAAEGLVGEKIREEQIIEQNAEYAEGVHQGDEEDPNAPDDAESMEESIPELVEDEEFDDEEDLQEEVNAPENDQRDEGDAQEGDPRDLGDAPQNDPQNEQRAPEGGAEGDPPHVIHLRRIEWEVRSARQVMIDLDDIVADLYKEQTCPSRKSRSGKITKREERFMPCTFCGVVGVHYSDSCPVVTSITDRKSIVFRDHRCERCLENDCPQTEACTKYTQRCFYCTQSGHHSALGKLPTVAMKFAAGFEQQLAPDGRLGRGWNTGKTSSDASGKRGE